MATKSVDLKKIVQAYKVTGLTPATGMFVDKDENKSCPLSTLYISKGKTFVEKMDRMAKLDESDDPEANLCTGLGLTTEYVDGFIKGVDDSDTYQDKGGGWELGYKHGCAVRRRLGKRLTK